MKIRINPFDEKSIAEALKVVQQYKRDFAAKEREFIERLAEIGASVAFTGFEVADYDGDKGDIDVWVEWQGNKALVMAEGEKIGFLEFGTGVRYPEWNGSGSDYTPPKHGTYGKGRGANPKGWYFTPGEGASQHTYGNPPAYAMLTARDEMVARITQIAREGWR